MKDLAREKLIVALDVDEKEEAVDLVNELAKWVAMFKVGIRLFSRYGPLIIETIKKKGGKVFFDAKFYDIPSVVEQTAKNIAEMGISMVTIHTLGGYEMMVRYKKAIKKLDEDIKVLGVTILTSLTNQELKDLGIKKDMEKEVLLLAKLAKKAGLDGVVSSAWEVELLRKTFSSDFLLVVPGIRGKEKASEIKNDEQRRTLTAKDAVKKGADFLVVGRPIIQAENPVKAAREILKEIQENDK